MSIEVYTRSVNESDAVHLVNCETVSDIEDLLKHIKRTGIYCDGDVHQEVQTQYVHTKDGTYFEIIIG